MKHAEFQLSNLIEVKLKNEDSFLVIKETLTRIGVASRKENILYQTAHILHKKGKYYILHFKYLFALDGRSYNITTDDIKRQNAIALLLQQWNLLEIVNKDIDKFNVSAIKVIPYKEKHLWNIVQKYSIGNKTNYPEIT